MQPFYVQECPRAWLCAGDMASGRGSLVAVLARTHATRTIARGEGSALVVECRWRGRGRKELCVLVGLAQNIEKPVQTPLLQDALNRVHLHRTALFVIPRVCPNVRDAANAIWSMDERAYH